MGRTMCSPIRVNCRVEHQRRVAADALLHNLDDLQERIELERLDSLHFLDLFRTETK
jgi:hypothetical protein